MAGEVPPSATAGQARRCSHSMIAPAPAPPIAPTAGGATIAANAPCPSHSAPPTAKCMTIEDKND